EFEGAIILEFGRDVVPELERAIIIEKLERSTVIEELQRAAIIREFQRAAVIHELQFDRRRAHPDVESRENVGDRIGDASSVTGTSEIQADDLARAIDNHRP